MTHSDDPIRVIVLSETTPIRSQSVYHAVGYALKQDTPDTIVLATSASPYVCIGFHQDAAIELDVAACSRLGLPIVRREVGGGAVYLDSQQIFAQWIFHPGHLHRGLADRFAQYVAPLVATYQAFGIDASYRPVNDIHVGDRKIGGTGAARLGGAEVVVGSIMLDFDATTMSQVLRTHSEKMRDKVSMALQHYITTMTRELGSAPNRDEVVARYLEECARSLERPLVMGALLPEELEHLATLEERFSSPTWTFRRTSRHVLGVRIHEDMAVHEGVHKAPSGLLRCTVVVQRGHILEAAISGDFTLLPQSGLAALEAGLVGISAAPDAVLKRVEAIYTSLGIDAPGLEPAEFAAACAVALGHDTERADSSKRTSL